MVSQKPSRTTRELGIPSGDSSAKDDTFRAWHCIQSKQLYLLLFIALHVCCSELYGQLTSRPELSNSLQIRRNSSRRGCNIRPYPSQGPASNLNAPFRTSTYWRNNFNLDMLSTCRQKRFPTGSSLAGPPSINRARPTSAREQLALQNNR
jgi:hypothetical protein